ncbi:ornithine carbamoyltransferase [Carnobacterium gallinarum]|uniref:ornithine carbamoyltransferase n=1 Tax=Carnobacterium gallinarum TaxID=2749 RepID=UPI000550F872|nr:ornithine carbamoyltransferase [Carnobacterium gallinarum]
MKQIKIDTLTLLEWSSIDLEEMIQLAIKIKDNPKDYRYALDGKILGMIFDKASTRTRVSFEAGMLQLGGSAIVLFSKDLQIGRGEPIKDTAHVLSEYLDGLMIRTFAHETVEQFAEYASIPIINGLTDLHHPCQALADLLTIYEVKGTFKQVQLTYLGDGNNVCHSLLLASALVGLTIHCATPIGYQVDPVILAKAQEIAKITGATITIYQDPIEAVKNADFIYTDVWTSMGQETENALRLKAFEGAYQVNAKLVAYAKSDYHFLHCLPAHREEEVTSEIIDGPHSLVYQQAGNRLHAQKALLLMSLF